MINGASGSGEKREDRQLMSRSIPEGRITRVSGINHQTVQPDAFEDNFLVKPQIRRASLPHIWIGETLLEVTPGSGYRTWSPASLSQEARDCLFTKGHFLLSNGDELSSFIRIHHLPEVNPVPRGGVNVPASTFHCNDQGHWTIWENRVPWSQRMLHLRCIEFADLARSYVRIYHNNEADRQPLVSEVFTDTEPVSKEASRRGHRVGTTICPCRSMTSTRGMTVMKLYALFAWRGLLE